MPAPVEALPFEFSAAENGLWVPSRSLELTDNFELHVFEGVVDLSYLSTPDMQLGMGEVTFPYGILSGIGHSALEMRCAIDIVKPIANAIWTYGNNHRNFPTGGVGLASSKILKHDQLFVVWGNNHKPNEGLDPERACTEEFLLGKARFLKARRMAALIVYAETQPDDRTGISEKALPACGNCRDIFTRDPLMTPSTILVSRNPRTGQEIRRTVGRLHDVYQDIPGKAPSSKRPLPKARPSAA